MKWLWTVLAVGAIATSASANLLLNGDFALDGTPAQIGSAAINNWTVWGNSGYYNNDIGGNMSVKMWWDDTGIYQDWACTAGTAYDLSVNALQQSGDPLVAWQGYLKVEFYDSGNTKLGESELDYLQAADAKDTWIPLTGTYTAPVSSAYGRIVLGINNWGAGAAGSAYFDNASVTQAIPEPAMASLLLIGGLLGARFLRKRK